MKTKHILSITVIIPLMTLSAAAQDKPKKLMTFDQAIDHCRKMSVPNLQACIDQKTGQRVHAQTSVKALAHDQVILPEGTEMNSLKSEGRIGFDGAVIVKDGTRITKTDTARMLKNEQDVMVGEKGDMSSAAKTKRDQVVINHEEQYSKAEDGKNIISQTGEILQEKPDN